MYNPVVGRWLSPDPLGRTDNSPEVVYSHKQVAARQRAVSQPYTYVENNPTNLVDPSGLAPLFDVSRPPLEGGGSPAKKAKSRPLHRLNMSHIPVDRVEGLVKDKIAQKFERFGARVVVMPFILNGRLRKIVLQWDRIIRVVQRPGFSICPGGIPEVRFGKPFYKFVGDGPMGMASDLLAENFVFDKIEAGRGVALASTVEFALHLVPFGTLADSCGGNKDISVFEVGVATALDATFILGLAAKAATGTVKGVKLARGAAAIQTGTGTALAGGTAYYTYEYTQGRAGFDDVIRSAFEATAILFGVKGAWKKARSLARRRLKNLGRPGRNKGIREVVGDEADARKLFDELRGSNPVKEVKPGVFVAQGKKGCNVTFRAMSKSGPPTVDVHGVEEGVRKIKFVEK